MSNENLICPICGEPTNVYMGKARRDRLCRKHGMQANKGELVQCPDCNTWNNAGEDCKCKKPATKTVVKELPKETSSSELKCIICGENSNGKDICKSCYAEVMSTQKDLDKNKKPWELKDYYYNLKAFISRLKDYNEATQNLYKLYAIAWLLKKIYDDDQLANVVNADVKFLLKGITRIKGLKLNEQQQQNAKTIIAVADIEKNRASDGHICKSEGEVIIDDILFKGNVCHAYERRVKEIPSDKERSVIADWFIPLGGFEGIYIEYWGMNTKDYQDNKEEKLKLYEKYSNEVKLIQIDKNDINDRQNLEDRLFSELKKFGWHK